MNEEELSEAEEARIRALLAEARHDEPMPEAVVARLDRVLAGLAEAPVLPSRPGNLIPLAQRRRRATGMLVAAAAVVLIAFGAGQVLRGGGGSADSASAGSAPEAARVTDSKGGTTSSGAGAPFSQDGVESRAFRLRPDHFAQDSRAVQLRAEKTRDADELAADRTASPSCSPGHWGSGRYVPVAYGDAPGYLVLRRPSGDSQVADLFLCSGDTPLRSITLPGP